MNNIKNNLLSVVKTLAVFVVIGFSVGTLKGENGKSAIKLPPAPETN